MTTVMSARMSNWKRMKSRSALAEVMPKYGLLDDEVWPFDCAESVCSCWG